MTLLRMLAFIPNDPQSIKRPKLQAQMPPERTTTISHATAHTNWSELLKQLEINGATLALAQQCQLKKQTETELHFILNPKQKPLLSDKHIKRIQNALSQYFAKPILVCIELDQATHNTPAELVKRKAEDTLIATEQAIIKDPTVQHIIKKFDATIIKNSINRIEEGD